MHFLTTLAVALLPVAAVAGQAAMQKLPFPDGPLTWVGAVDDSGKNITLTGTHNEIVAHLKTLNPSWMRDPIPEGIPALNSSETHLEKRGRVSYACNESMYGKAWSIAVIQGYQYIKSHFGDGWCYVNANTCTRLFCDGTTEISLCNSANNFAVMPCSALAQNVAFLFNTCTGYYMEGQAFYFKPTYNVLIKYPDNLSTCNIY